MVITIDLSYVPDRVRSLIRKSIDLKYHPNQNECMILLQDEANVEKIKSILEQILKENTIEDFVVTENTEKENEITLLKQGDLEQLGIFLCTHCGVSFGSEIQRVVHQRIHYFG
jgi:pyridoxal/pyridoxine/pyridoxamine kinase